MASTVWLAWCAILGAGVGYMRRVHRQASPVTSSGVDSWYARDVFHRRCLDITPIILIQVQLFDDVFLGADESHCEKHHVALVHLLSTCTCHVSTHTHIRTFFNLSRRLNRNLSVNPRCGNQLWANFAWNSLPEDVVTVPLLNSYKGRFDTANRHLRYVRKCFPRWPIQDDFESFES